MAFALGDISASDWSARSYGSLSRRPVYELDLVMGLSGLAYFGQDRPESPGSIFPESRPG